MSHPAFCGLARQRLGETVEQRAATMVENGFDSFVHLELPHAETSCAAAREGQRHRTDRSVTGSASVPTRRRSTTKGRRTRTWSSGGKPVQRRAAGKWPMPLWNSTDGGRPGAWRMTVSAALAWLMPIQRHSGASRSSQPMRKSWVTTSGGAARHQRQGRVNRARAARAGSGPFSRSPAGNRAKWPTTASADSGGSSSRCCM